jgi:hypothetical protein
MPEVFVASMSITWLSGGPELSSLVLLLLLLG